MMAAQTISATEFKQKCLAIMDEVAAEGNEIVITKRGKAICRLVPLKNHPEEKRFGWMKGSISILSDLTKSLEEHWDADE